MIDKVIIAEDHESSNLSVQITLDELKIQQSDYVYYCDDALNRISQAKKGDLPYDVLITDLSFEEDGTLQKLADGYELIKAARAVQPDIMILVFSGEDRPAIISKLFKEYEIDAFVRKARHDVKELKAAFEALSKRQKYYPHGIAQLMRQATSYQLTDSDLRIIRLLAKGYAQKEVEAYLKKNNIEPNSLSWIEKKLKEVRDELGFTKNTQLIVYCQEQGLL